MPLVSVPLPQTVIENYVEEKRIIHLPLESVDICSVCDKTTPPLRLCSSCGEKVYCSSECQARDWPIHRPSCGKTDRIDLTSFYPFLACLAEVCQWHVKKPNHIAKRHTILNLPEVVCPVRLPDRSGAVSLILGDEISDDVTDPALWWPTAPSPAIRSKILRRIQHEGYTLQLTTALCLSLLRGVYTSTFVRTSDDPYGRARRRVRLQYKKSPISDFGIIKGVAHVNPQDRLAYFRADGTCIGEGQNPDEHHWIYFTTLSGEEVMMDCGVYSFNLSTSVPTDPYQKSLAIPHSKSQSAPAYFLDLKPSSNAPYIATPQQKFSILRNEALHKAIQNHSPNIGWESVFQFMESVAGARSTAVEQDLTKFWTFDNCGAMDELIRKRGWEGWPAEPVLETETSETHPDRAQQPEKDWLNCVEERNETHDRPSLPDAFEKTCQV